MGKLFGPFMQREVACRRRCRGLLKQLSRLCCDFTKVPSRCLHYDVARTHAPRFQTCDRRVTSIMPSTSFTSVFLIIVFRSIVQYQSPVIFLSLEQFVHSVAPTTTCSLENSVFQTVKF